VGPTGLGSDSKLAAVMQDALVQSPPLKDFDDIMFEMIAARAHILVIAI
jgi:hypothetical protein